MGWGLASGGMGGGTARTADRSWAKEYPIPCHIMSAAEVWERRIKQKDKCWCLSSGVFISSPLQMMGPCFPGSGWTLLATESGQWIPRFALFARADLTSSSKFPLLQPMSFLPLALPMNKWLCGAGWLPELNHNYCLIQLQRKSSTSGFYKCVWQSY